MTKYKPVSFKAVLMSALFFPGSGLFIVKKKLAGSIFIGIALMNISVIFSVLSSTIEYRMERLLSGLNFLSENTATDLFAPLSSSDHKAVLITSIILTVVWASSVYLSWHYGRTIDSIERIKQENP